MTNDAKGTTTVAPRKRAPTKATTGPAKTAAPRARKATAAPPPLPPAGWYPDPAAPDTTRYWDGEGWAAADPESTVDAHDWEKQTAAAAGRITFHGRSMRVHSLSVEQIGVWRRVARQFETANEPLPSRATDQMVETRKKHLARALDRAMEIILTVLVDESDQDWVETQLLTRRLSLNEAVKIISLAIEDFTARNSAEDNAEAPDRNRAQRRAADAKARRRA